MESVDSTPNSAMQENLLTNEHLQACCEEITTQKNRYDYYIRRQLEKTIKNYKICIELCEEKLNLLDTYKDYRSVLATLSAGKKDAILKLDTYGALYSKSSKGKTALLKLIP